MPGSTIRAAGGVVWQVRDGRLQVAVVHRPRYDDWSLPKGKLERGESELAAAVREVREEIGADVAVGRRLSRIGYDVGGAPKTVAFWSMRRTGGEFEPNDEVDELRWLSLDDAAALLHHDGERAVLSEFRAMPPADSLVVLVRHAKAGKRAEWTGDDALRPLDATGVAQAKRLATFLGRFRPDQVISASPVRCVDTVAPLAHALGHQVVVDPVFSDDVYVTSPSATAAALTALARPARVTVVASQGTTIPGVVASLSPATGDAQTKKGAVWVLSFVDGTLASADYYPDAARED